MRIQLQIVRDLLVGEFHNEAFVFSIDETEVLTTAISSTFTTPVSDTPTSPTNPPQPTTSGGKYKSISKRIIS